MVAWRDRAFDVYMRMVNWLLAFPGHMFRIWVLRRLADAQVGNDVTIERGVRVTTRGKLSVGDRSIINRDTVLDSRAALIIGAHVNISPGVSLITGDHDPDSAEFAGRHRPIYIGDRAWVATGAMILPGTNLGQGVVVSAGSVVRGTVPPWKILAGNPAVIIRDRPRSAQAELRPYRRTLH
jgi:maltose O-acetyltransferase